MQGSTTAALLALLLGITAHLGAANQCYVCVPREGASRFDVAREFKTDVSRLPDCDDFHKATNVERYRMQCPESHFSGCFTQINGSHVTRSCSDKMVNDCGDANGIFYCYCKEPLCNDRSSHQTKLRQPHGSSPPDDDDEADVPEHSGEGPLPPEKPEVVTRVPAPSAATTTDPRDSSVATISRTLWFLPLFMALACRYTLI